jgi:hypothetical protein
MQQYESDALDAIARSSAGGCLMGRTYFTDWRGWLPEFAGLSDADLKERIRLFSGQLNDHGALEYAADPHSIGGQSRREVWAKRHACRTILLDRIAHRRHQA